RAYLAGRLPGHMVPGQYVTLGALPLTANGKVDRKALPEPEAGGTAGEGYEAPGTELEVEVAGMWAGLLGAERVGVSNDFFELGGHSLLATQVASRVRERYGVEVALRELFERPTVRDLCRLIEQMRAEGAEAEAPAIVPVSREARRVRRSSLNED
ncbi:MAG TPA: phosphopantetheine-binding protein, partial [Pyrinomonadaceae bacterium]